MFNDQVRKKKELRRLLNISHREVLHPTASSLDSRNTLDLGEGAHLLLQFQFLDLLLGSLGFPSSASRANYPKVPLEQAIPKHLAKVPANLPFPFLRS
jgi:hypothetical protein